MAMYKNYGTSYQFANDTKWRLELQAARGAHKERVEEERMASMYAENMRNAQTFANHAPRPILEEKVCPVHDFANWNPIHGDLIQTAHVSETSGRPGLKTEIIPSTFHTKEYGREGDNGPSDTKRWGPRSQQMYAWYKFQAPKKLHAMPYYIRKQRY